MVNPFIFLSQDWYSDVLYHHHPKKHHYLNQLTFTLNSVRSEDQISVWKNVIDDALIGVVAASIPTKFRLLYFLVLLFYSDIF
jgi:hypothetical protein